uniref:F-box domain-containing protein n=2 Tax=Rhizophora mucronata TaxID=61149 RepID=A0A2P2KJM2_RHIMU
MEEATAAKNVRRNFSDRGCGYEGEDRLSNLPDHIIQHILSFLETKDAIKTSVLSKQWRFHCNCLPVLNFNSYSFSRVDSYKKFVYSVLSHPRPTPITKLRFVGMGQEKPIVVKVFRYVFYNGIEHLIMDASKASYLLPKQILTYRPLKTLDLSSFVLPQSFHSSTIVVLRLRNCSFSAGRGGYLNPFAGCPNLNQLSLDNLDFKGCKVFKISAPQLLGLTISSTTRSNYRRVLKNCVFEISTPKLNSFRYEAVAAAMDFVSMDLPCVQYVDIAFSLPFVQSREAYLSLTKLLQGLQNSQFVSLATSTIKALNAFPDMLENQPSPFNRLKSLMLKPNGECTSLVIPIMVVKYLCGGSPSAEIHLL